MIRPLICAAMAAVLCVGNGAFGQARRNPQPETSAQTAGAASPSDFASCQPIGEAERTFYGPKTTYLKCAPALGQEDYGSVFVRFKPPSRTEFQGVDRRRKRDILSTLQRFFLPQQNSASLVLTLSLARQGAVGTAPPPEVPIAVVTLSSFTYDQNQGLRFSDNSETISNTVGYRFRIATGDRVRARIRVLYGRGTTSNIVGTITDLSKSLSMVGVLGAVSATAVQPLANIETSITNQALVDTRSDKATDLSFEPRGYSGLYVPVRIEPDRANDGSLFIALQRESSIFKSAVVEQGAVKFKVSGYDINSTNPIASTYFGDKTIAESLQTAVGTSFLRLSGTEPVPFDVACQTLWENIDTRYNLSTADKIATFWAIFLSAAKDNAGRDAIRQTGCIASKVNSGQFERLGLPLPAVAVELSEEYKALQAQAEKAASLGQDGAQAARKASDSAHGFAARARLTPPGVGTAHPQSDAFDYYGQDYAQASIAQQRFLGSHQFLTGARDEYAGEFALNGSQPIREGNGVLTYDTSSQLGLGRRQFLGAFVANVPNGFGELDYVDGSVYFGQLIRDLPSGLGKLITPEGAVQVGYFQNGKLQGKAIETSRAGRVRYGLWVNGILVSPAM